MKKGVARFRDIVRELDLTYLNHERFVLVRAMMGGRMFSTNELGNYRETSENS